MTALPTGIHYGIPVEEYRRDVGFNQSTLKAFAGAASPAHFRYDQDNPPEETVSLRIGNYVDAAVMSPQTLAERFAVWPGDRRGNEWKAFKEANASKSILNETEYERCVGMLTSLAKHLDTQRILAACRKQAVVIADHPSLLCRMKSLQDLLPDPELCHPSLLEYDFDLKTSVDASQDGFAKQAAEQGYDIQATWYMDALEYCGRYVKRFGFIVVENTAPYCVAIHYFDRDAPEIVKAREKLSKWVPAYRECLTKNHWPGYGDNWTRIQFKPWHLKEQTNNRTELS